MKGTDITRHWTRRLCFAALCLTVALAAACGDTEGESADGVSDEVNNSNNSNNDANNANNDVNNANNDANNANNDVNNANNDVNNANNDVNNANNDVNNANNDAQGCESSDACGEGFYCEFPQGSCGQGEPGTCVEIGDGICGEIFAPVCGCDEVTYENPCAAGAAGVSIAAEGECEGPGPIACDSENPCDEGFFCECEGDACGGAGVCAPRPDGCDDNFEPVCGCDGETYSNDCERQAAGACLAAQGACEQAPTACRGNDACGEGAFCEFEGGTCDVPDREGRCTPTPEFCNRLLAPVCGCDGETYGNDCERQRAGVALAHTGECEVEPPSPCALNSDCERGEVCYFDIGVCGGGRERGTCDVPPEVCTRELAPVCGCDGETYTNPCEAARARVSIASRGECEVEPPAECETNRDCGEGFFCECEGDTCGAGQCAERPEICNRLLAPVCGCDNETYGNDCERRAAGVCLLHRGACEEPPNACRSNGDCGRAQYCALEEGTCGGVGECTVRPQFCPENFDPVCGCDGTTYSNDCFAANAGVSIDSDGECEEEPPQICGGIRGLLCEEGEICDRDPGQCLISDAQGVCVPSPEVCPLVIIPVCGCDGRTYNNNCERLRAGVALDREGPCDDEPADPCRNNADCGARNLFCEFPEATCGEEGLGSCTERPMLCPQIFDPVCGCDGMTYSNDCTRQGAGVSKAADGPCEL